MNQLAIDFARAARDEGISRAVDHAESDSPGWGELAFRYIQLYAQQHRGERFIGRDIVLASKAYGLIQPPTDKAWGGPMQKAAKRGVLRKVGTAPDPNRHCNPVPLWEAVDGMPWMQPDRNAAGDAEKRKDGVRDLSGAKA